MMLSRRSRLDPTVFSVLFLLFVVAPAPQKVGASICTNWAYDLPGVCPCAQSLQGWPTSDAPGQPLLIFDQLLGAVSWCADDRGQPYWQIQKYWSSPAAVALMANYINEQYPAWPADTDQSNWCSETVSYAHFRAQFPYLRGFASPALNSSRLKNVTQLRTWYQTEEQMTADGVYQGRGSWVDGSEFDPTNFRPGINGPVPGAYQLIEDYTVAAGWLGASTGHSQMIESMFVTIDVAGNVMSVDAVMVEGNVNPGITLPDSSSQTRARRTMTLQRLEMYTVIGNWDFRRRSPGIMRKVRGWGIPIGPTGSPQYDPAALVVHVDLSSIYKQILDKPELPGSPDGIVLNLAEFMQTTEGIISVSAGSGITTTQDFPTPDAPWDIRDPSSSIQIDLGADYPIPLRGVALTWRAGFVPMLVDVEMADDGGTREIVQTGFDLAPSEPVLLNDANSPYDIPMELVLPLGSTTVRTLVMRFPPQPWGDTAQLVGLDFLFDLGTEDIDYEPEWNGPTPVIPPEAALGRNLVWDLANGTVFYRQVETAFRSGLDRPVIASVYDVRGRLIRSLGTVASVAGRHPFNWDGSDGSSAPVAQGVYFLRLDDGDTGATLKVLLTR